MEVVEEQRVAQACFSWAGAHYFFCSREPFLVYLRHQGDSLPKPTWSFAEEQDLFQT